MDAAGKALARERGTDRSKRRHDRVVIRWRWKSVESSDVGRQGEILGSIGLLTFLLGLILLRRS